MSGIKAGIIGASGYTGSELVRLLTLHPEVSLEVITSESKAGEKFSALHPQFTGLAEMKLQKMETIGDHELDIVFLALPHGVSMNFVKEQGIDRFKVIDLSGDFRLPSTGIYEKWYKKEHIAPGEIQNAAYGLPELFREEIKKADLVANPGCYPTSAILPLAPLLKYGLIEEKGIITDSKSGVTGAGAKVKAKTHFPEVFGNFSAYGLLQHRHTPEIEHSLSKFCGQQIEVLFTPHLLPIDRGILTTTYSTPKSSVNGDTLHKALGDLYGKEPFVRVLQTPPSVKNVRGSNYSDVFVTYDPRNNKVLTVSALDNLVKGAAGQAIQNMNLMFGLEEATGIRQLPLSP